MRARFIGVSKRGGRSSSIPCCLRCDNDPINLGLWFATVIHLFVIEIRFISLTFSALKPTWCGKPLIVFFCLAVGALAVCSVSVTVWAGVFFSGRSAKWA